jgi:hypothetical protein
MPDRTAKWVRLAVQEMSHRLAEAEIVAIRRAADELSAAAIQVHAKN